MNDKIENALRFACVHHTDEIIRLIEANWSELQVDIYTLLFGVTKSNNDGK